MVGLIVAGASAAVSAATSLYGASQASGAAKDAADLSARQQAQTRADLLPYNQAGQGVLGDLSDLVKSGPYGGGTNYLQMAQDNLPGNMTQAQLEATPGYQFSLSQGLKSTQNAAAARGLGVSGAALKGAATFATGLADNTYQNQFANAQTKYSDILGLNTGQQGNLTNQYNRLIGTATLGQNAAAQTGTQGTLSAANQATSTIAGGNASAAGTVGVGKAIAGGANSYLGYNALQQYLGNGSGNGTTGGYVDSGAWGD